MSFSHMNLKHLLQAFQSKSKLASSIVSRSGRGHAPAKVMRLMSFSFEREPFWMWVCSLVPVVVGITIALVITVVRKFLL